MVGLLGLERFRVWVVSAGFKGLGLKFMQALKAMVSKDFGLKGFRILRVSG